MPYLIVAVVLVGVLCMLNLLLTVGVIRRLRKQAASAAFLPPMAEGLAIGEKLPEFSATTTDGEPISDELLGGPALIGFFSPSCQPCRELMPRFIDHARQSSAAVLAVVVTDSAEEAVADVERLTEVARVVVEEPQAAIQSAFQVVGYPTVFLIGADGRVTDNNPLLPTTVSA
ncbi:TlpA family protein disulfide reductase [Nonomuraea turkmeniaca]|uniref:TlpA family protein disulfide reductase n=1 Tax=Nonomuraea turkmeniaca TaxID=103838 RepID=A0A5S4FNQ5_9ACTN|nr:TlpA disulfide reductase family protein [Nonomuraea turkmeniaca]TMR22377.1 TlpA family protein disulfide reductase [Nonomuraea turkmeniaca]